MLHRPMIKAACLTSPVVACVCMTATTVVAQSVAAPFERHYTVTNLGVVPELPPTYGGLVFEHDDPGTLLIAGKAGTADGAIYAVPVQRDARQYVVGFAGPAVYEVDAAGLDGGGINGSLSYVGPHGYVGHVLTYSTSPDNTFGQIPGSEYSFNLEQQISGHLFRPDVLWEDTLKIVTRDPGQWWRGQFFLEQSSSIIPYADELVCPIDGGPGAFVYVPNVDPLSAQSDILLIAKTGGGRVDGYAIDAAGDPTDAAGFAFVNDLPGADGMTVDPLTGDVFVTSSVTNTITVVRRTDPVPLDAGMRARVEPGAR